MVLATAGVVVSLLLATALFGYATNPWQRVFSQSDGAHAWIHTGPSAKEQRVAHAEGVESVAGPYPTVGTALRSRGIRAAVELRGVTSMPVTGRPLLTAGRWLDAGSPDGVVLESSLARALWAEPGDVLSLPGAGGKLTVLGIADSAEPPYRPGDRPGLVWARPSTVRNTAGPVGQVIGLRLVHPEDTDYVVQRAVTLLGADAVTEVVTWRQARAAAQDGGRLLGQVLGLFGLGSLMAAGFAVHGTIGTRIRGHLRDISVLKAIGFTPGQVVRIYLVQHVALASLGALIAGAFIWLRGSRLPGRLGDAVGLWQGLRGHTPELFAVPVSAIVCIAAMTGLAAWRAGRVPAVPGRRAAYLDAGLPSLVRGALGLRVPAAAVLGWHKAFPRNARTSATVIRLALPLFLIVVAMSAWTTIDRLHHEPDRMDLVATPTVRSDGTSDDAGLRGVMALHAQVADVYEGVQVAALVPGQTGTILLRGLGTRQDPYPFALAEGRRATGPDEAVAGQGLLDLLDLRVGDWVRMTVGQRPQVLHIVGRTIEPENGGRVISASFDTVHANDPTLSASLYEIRLRPGADPRAAAADLTAAAHGRVDVHPVANPADGFAQLNGLVVGVIAVLALIGLIDTLAVIGGTVREGERDVPALRAMGMTPRQIRAIVMTATGCTAFAAVLLATVTGLPLAHWLINAQGRVSGVGAGIAQGPPLWVLPVFAVTATLGAAVLAVVPATRAGHRRFGDTLGADA